MYEDKFDLSNARSSSGWSNDFDDDFEDAWGRPACRQVKNEMKESKCRSWLCVLREWYDKAMGN